MIYFRSRGALFGECWFDQESPAADCNADVLAFRQLSSPVPASYCTPNLTLVSELTADADDLLAGFGRHCRRSIREADRRDGLWMEFAARPGPLLRDFCDFYDEFARHKRLRPADGAWLQAACDANRFALATVWRGREPLVRHGYVVGGQTILLHCSASLFRLRDQEHRALISRANRWLHWRSMLYFSEHGATHYDWGGLFEDESTPERMGVNRFKKEFGGHPVRRFDCLVARSARGHLRLGMKRLGDGWRYVGARVATLRQPPPRPAAPVHATQPETSQGVDA
jgi:hypothetical protein